MEKEDCSWSAGLYWTLLHAHHEWTFNYNKPEINSVAKYIFLFQAISGEYYSKWSGTEREGSKSWRWGLRFSPRRIESHRNLHFISNEVSWRYTNLCNKIFNFTCLFCSWIQMIINMSAWIVLNFCHFKVPVCLMNVHSVWQGEIYDVRESHWKWLHQRWP